MGVYLVNILLLTLTYVQDALGSKKILFTIWTSEQST